MAFFDCQSGGTVQKVYNVCTSSTSGVDGSVTVYTLDGECIGTYSVNDASIHNFGSFTLQYSGGWKLTFLQNCQLDINTTKTSGQSITWAYNSWVAYYICPLDN